MSFAIASEEFVLTSRFHELLVFPHSLATREIMFRIPEVMDTDAFVALPTRSPYTRDAPAFMALVMP
jgi:hypothetical protein